jgi:hypothetical protein
MTTILLDFCSNCAHKILYPILQTHQTERKMSEENTKVALVTGITGQDGSYLTELLLEKGYTVSE